MNFETPITILQWQKTDLQQYCCENLKSCISQMYKQVSKYFIFTVTLAWLTTEELCNMWILLWAAYFSNFCLLFPINTPQKVTWTLRHLFWNKPFEQLPEGCTQPCMEWYDKQTDCGWCFENPFCCIFRRHMHLLLQWVREVCYCCQQKWLVCYLKCTVFYIVSLLTVCHYFIATNTGTHFTPPLWLLTVPILFV